MGMIHTQQDVELLPRNNEWVALYRSGQTLQCIGNAYGVTRERVRQVLSGLGVKSRACGPPREPREPREPRQPPTGFTRLPRGTFQAARGTRFLGIYDTAAEAHDAYVKGERQATARNRLTI